MATRDLGTIDVLQDAGPVSTQVGGDVLGGILGGAVKGGLAIAEGVTAEGARRDFEEIVDSEVQDSALAEGAVEVRDFDDEVSPAGQRLRGPKADLVAESLMTEIRRYDRISQRSSGSKQLNASMQMRAHLQDLRVKRPLFARAMEAELTNIERFDPEFAVLGMIDAADKNAAGVADDQLELYKQFAYHKSAADGGWLLDPARHPFGSREFALAASWAGGLQTTRRHTELQMEALGAQDEFHSRESMEGMQSYISGQGSVVSKFLKDSQKMRTELTVAMLNPDSPANQQTLANAENQISAMKSNMELAINDMYINLQAAFPLTQQGEASYVQAKAAIDQYASAISDAVTALDTGDFGPMATLQVMEAAREIRWWSDNPEAAYTIWAVDKVVPYLSVMEEKDLSGTGREIFHNIARSMNHSMTSTIGRALAITDAGNLDPRALPYQINSHLAARQAVNPDQYGHGMPDPEADMVGALQQQRDNTDAIEFMRSQEGISVPEVDLSMALDRVGTLQHIARLGNGDEGQLSEAMSEATPPGIIDLFRSAEASHEYINDAWAGHYENVYNQYHPKRNAKYKAMAAHLMQSEVAPTEKIALSQLLELDLEAIEEGIVNFTVNQDRLDVVMQDIQNSGVYARRAAGSKTSATRLLKTERANAERQAQELKAQLTRQISQDLTSHARYLAVKSGASEPDFAGSWVSSGLAALFKVAEEE